MNNTENTKFEIVKDEVEKKVIQYFVTKPMQIPVTITIPEISFETEDGTVIITYKAPDEQGDK